MLTINIRPQPKKTFSVATITVAPTTAEAETTYGICGIKVWINKGEILSKDPFGSEKNQVEQGSIR